MTYPKITLDDIQQALDLHDFDAISAHMKMAPQPRTLRRPDREGQPRMSAVLLLIYPTENDSLAFVMTVRQEYAGVHSGQISLPGGRHENGETFLQTALRETYEELGVPQEQIAILGQLNQIYIPPSDFEVYPFVGYSAQRPLWQPDPFEVAKVIEMPIHSLLDVAVKRTEEWTLRGFTMQVPFYLYGEYKIWGATAIMLSELENRLTSILNGRLP